VTLPIERIRAILAPTYTVDRELGRGGWATVYLALDAKHDRMVALKVLHPELVASFGPGRFLQEIRIVARLNHPHILPLFDSGQVEGLLYYVMPYVEGESLRARLLRQGKMAVSETLHYACAIATALDYAHRQNIVHRDVKPENVMLHEGEPMIMDFGIAKAASLRGAQGLSQMGMMVGTPAYVSPEQALGEDVDGRSDQYSLACMLYEMLSGHQAFTGATTQAVMAKRFVGMPRRVRELCASVPEHVDQAIYKAMSADAPDRFETTAEFAQALRSGGPVAPTDALAWRRDVSSAKSVAVLPFANMSADPDNEYFTDGISEEIINALTKIQSLRVAPRTSSFAFKGKSEDIGDIGRRLRVSTVLEGSVRRAGTKLRITAQLVNVADGYPLWSERYDRELEDVFAIQDDISEAIVKALRVILTEGEKKAISKARTHHVKAYEFYLRGRQYFHQWNRKSLEFARQMFDRAIEIDPGYALAYAGIADSCSVLYSYWDASDFNLQTADVASAKALALEPELAEAHVARGNAILRRREYGAAEKEFRTAMRLDPKLFDAPYFYGRALKSEGRLPEAAKMFERASVIRPDDIVAQSFLAAVLDDMGLATDAKEAQDHTIRLLEERIELNPDDARAVNLGASIFAATGDRDRTMTYIKRSLELNPDDAPTHYNIACSYAQLGMADEAFSHLETGIAMGWRHREWLENDHDFDSIRETERFRRIVESL
jgi:serine/threonine protein kinase/tetratricopeptide (TPR) repeat protein